MGDFRLGKAAVLGKAPVSTGFKLGMGKVPQCVFGVHINDPTGNVMALHDAYRGKCFEGGDAGLAGYPYRAEVAYTPSVGGAAGYQFLAQVYYARDAAHGGAAGNVNGTEQLDGEPEPIPKIYLNQLCKWDFSDVRFALKGSTTAYTYKLIEKVDGVSALFLFKMNENPDSARTVCCYWGLQTATDESSDAAAEAIIPNVVGAWPLDEIYTETENAFVIYDGVSSAWTAQNHNAGPYRSVVTQEADRLKIAITADGEYGEVGAHITLNDITDFTSRDVFVIELEGSGSNQPFSLFMSDITWTIYGSFPLIDNFVGRKTFMFSMGSITGNAAVLSQVKYVRLMTSTNTAPFTVYLRRLVVDDMPEAKDYSGNGNTGAATGTTIETTGTKYIGKFARRFYNDKIQLGNFAYDFSGNNPITIFANLKPSTQSVDWPIWFSLERSAPSRDGYACFASKNPQRLVFSRYVNHITIAGTDVNVAFNGSWYSFIGSYDGINKFLSVNSSDTPPIEDTNVIPSFAKAPTIGVGEPGTRYVGLISDLIIFSNVLSTEQKTALRTGYPDPKLIAGSVIVRKWASTTLPTVASVGSMQVRRAYGKQELYPALDNLNFTLDQAAKKASIEFYLENTQTESASKAVLVDSNPAATWTTYGTGTTLSNDTAISDLDAASLKIVWTNAAQWAGATINYGTNQNWSANDFICFPIKGCNSGLYYQIKILAPDDSNCFYTTITDNFIGTKYFVLAKNAFGVLELASWSTVRAIRILVASANATTTLNIGKVCLDVGVWAYMEIGIPDQLQTQGTIQMQTLDIDSIRIYTWNGSAWAAGTVWDTSNWVWRTVSSYFLNGGTFKTTYGESQDFYSLLSAVLFVKGKRGETKGRKSTHMANQTITYSKAKTKYSFGFAIKMPPTDLNASATTGIGQTRLKLEIYYI